eukprot:353230-Chlamydomonas_euryale.AAC.2
MAEEEAGEGTKARWRKRRQKMIWRGAGGGKQMGIFIFFKSSAFARTYSGVLRPVRLSFLHAVDAIVAGPPAHFPPRLPFNYPSETPKVVMSTAHNLHTRSCHSSAAAFPACHPRHLTLHTFPSN